MRIGFLMRLVDTAENFFFFDKLLRYSSQSSKPIIFLVERTVSVSSKFTFRRHFTTFYHSSYRSDNLVKIILIFLLLRIYYCHWKRKYKLHRFVYCFQVLNLNSIEYLRFTNCYGRANKKKHILAQRNMIGHHLFASEPIEKLFPLHEAIFKVPK